MFQDFSFRFLLFSWNLKELAACISSVLEDLITHTSISSERTLKNVNRSNCRDHHFFIYRNMRSRFVIFLSRDQRIFMEDNYSVVYSEILGEMLFTAKSVGG